MSIINQKKFLFKFVISINTSIFNYFSLKTWLSLQVFLFILTDENLH